MGNMMSEALTIAQALRPQNAAFLAVQALQFELTRLYEQERRIYDDLKEAQPVAADEEESPAIVEALQRLHRMMQRKETQHAEMLDLLLKRARKEEA